MRIAFLTFEFDGLTKNGGIGTAYRRLAELLANEGHSITIVFLPFGKLREDLFSRKTEIWSKIHQLKRTGFDVVLPEIANNDPKLRNLSFHLRRSWQAYQYLKRQNFDVVHVSDNCGLAYFSLMAKKQRLAFEKTAFVMGAHGSLLWTQEANSQYSVNSLSLAELDKQSVALSDVLVSPSAYMVGYMRKNGWALPKDVRVIPNANAFGKGSKLTGSVTAQQRSRPKTHKSITFFGRLETRKGIFVFLDALQALLDENPKLGTNRQLQVHFLGKDAEPIKGIRTEDLIWDRLAPYLNRLSLAFYPDHSSDDGLKFLAQSRDNLVCMPSLLDNSPYVVLEAIEYGLDFVTSSSGGQSELIHPSGHRSVLFRPTVESLKSILKRRISGPAIRVQPSQSVLQANLRWVQLHQDISKRKKAKRVNRARNKKPPLVSIVIGAESSLNPALEKRELTASLASVLKQDYPRLQICLPEDIRTETTTRKGIRFSYFEKARIADRRALITDVAKGKYILFLDTAVLHSKATLSEWVQAAESAKSDKKCVGLVGLEGDKGRFWDVPHVCYGYVAAFSEDVQVRHALWRRSELAQLISKSANSLEIFPMLPFWGKTIETFPGKTVVKIKVVHEFWRKITQGQLPRIRSLQKVRSSRRDWEKVALLAMASNTELRTALLTCWNQANQLAQLGQKKET
jgi:glycosyltransferase involved in cell wall biosynthesis